MLSDHAILLPIDVQRAFDDPSWGRRNNPAMEAQGLRLLAAWRGAGRPVIHVKHNSALPNSTLRPGQPGNAFKTGFEPLAGEALIEKTVNADFIGPALEGELRARVIAQTVSSGIHPARCVLTNATVGPTHGQRARAKKMYRGGKDR